MRLNTANISRICKIVIPRSSARKTKKASEELPKSKIPTIIIKVMKFFPSPLNVILVFCASPLGLTSFAPNAKTSTAKNAGIMLISTMVLKVCSLSAALPACSFHTTKAAISSPSIAPAVSAARCNPKAKPRCSSFTSSAKRASRGAVRMPLPTRSAQRMAATASQVLAR